MDKYVSVRAVTMHQCSHHNFVIRLPEMQILLQYELN